MAIYRFLPHFSRPHHGQVAFWDLYRPPNVCFSIWPKCQVLFYVELEEIFAVQVDAADTGRKTTMIITLWWSYEDMRHTFFFVHSSLAGLFPHMPCILFQKQNNMPRFNVRLHDYQTRIPFDVMVVQWIICSHVRRGRKIEIKKNRDCLNRDATFHDTFQSLINAAIHIIGTKLS